ncbi:SDR family oxidoreductase [Lentzea flava]|uniref:3-oxoacyl-ACP reductase n=1 Tax=Lentzea flava TaxID=103732 RepID=A0ABQ2UKU1_9PSEU|nr:SDR family oxidoreductase [Lentzea flava]MCP2199674.1 3-oxoacyl-[acyl-carrier protein] reductase [Lentzea flava]GGU39106.1 3-oxoacyl-ACP reductase [Lentzea flava]
MTRVAIVTGGSRGIGRAAAERLAADGMAVVIVYAGNKTEADKAVEEIKAAGGQAIAARADVADEIALGAAFDLAAETFGGVDVVVNSAGIMPLGTVADMDLDVFDRLMRTNARGTFVVSQQAARKLRNGGAIINLSSSVVGLRFPQYGAYAMSKGGVEALTLVLARELRGRDITVNAVAPGPTATALFLEGKDEATIDTLAKQAPLERIGSPEDIAEVISFLAGPARWINGQVVRANGGII